jgi:hypothetical protein
MRFMRRKSFMLKAAANLRMLRDIGGQDLRATKRWSFIDDTHTTTELFDDAILGDGLVDHQCRKNIGQS